MAKVRATRHNGRTGKNGVFRAGHNDSSFDVEQADHIDPSRSYMNVYWDCVTSPHRGLYGDHVSTVCNHEYSIHSFVETFSPSFS